MPSTALQPPRWYRPFAPLTRILRFLLRYSLARATRFAQALISRLCRIKRGDCALLRMAMGRWASRACSLARRSLPRQRAVLLLAALNSRAVRNCGCLARQPFWVGITAAGEL